ncbi:Exodeoxyribonuclease I subunit D [Ruminococcaceae bacterium YRB3002]|nr:Exodeoxyribonuclease I subunit D [Ruminococcaceae bacterium YRB3002]
MRLFHIADLHIGKSIYGRSMIEDQKYWIDKFLTLCDERHPDAVLIAGDVYDRANPSAEAADLMGYFLTELVNRSIPVYMIAGNHDSGQRLAAMKDIIAKQGIYVAGNVSKEIVHYTLPDPDGFGPVTFWLVPYLIPEAVAQHLGDESIHTYTDAMRRLLEEQDIDSSHRNIIISHQNVVVNGEEVEYGGSEKVGGVGQTDYSVYDDFDYVALGHIHSGLMVGKQERIRYAGTPLCYHFDETKFRKKGVVEVVIDRKGSDIRPETITIEPLHTMRYIHDPAEKALARLQDEVQEGDYVGVVITDKRMTPEMSDYIKGIVESRNAYLFEHRSEYRSFTNSGASARVNEINEKPIEDLFMQFYIAQKGADKLYDEEKELMHFIGEMVRNSQSEDDDDADAEKILSELLRITGGNE